MNTAFCPKDGKRIVTPAGRQHPARTNATQCCASGARSGLLEVVEDRIDVDQLLQDVQPGG